MVLTKTKSFIRYLKFQNIRFYIGNVPRRGLFENFKILEFQGPYGPLKNSSPCGGILASLTWFLASLGNKLWKIWILITDKQTL